MMAEDCRSCLSLAGDRILPGAPIFDGKYWTIEHVYPSEMAGRLVLVLKRHAVGAHEMTGVEFAEMYELLERTVRLLCDAFHTEKEYVMLLAEGEGFRHVQIHVVAAREDLPGEYRGVRVSHYLKPETEPIPPDEVRRLANDLARRFALSVPEKQVGPQRIFHIATSSEWNTHSDSYSPRSIVDDGFIHCATAAQVLRVADAFFADQTDLVLLSIDAAGVQDLLVYEDCHEMGERYPHVYGPLPVDAITAVLPFPGEPDGTFALPDGMALTGD